MSLGITDKGLEMYGKTVVPFPLLDLSQFDLGQVAAPAVPYLCGWAPQIIAMRSCAKYSWQQPVMGHQLFSFALLKHWSKPPPPA